MAKIFERSLSGREYQNARGNFTRRLYVQQLENEYWEDLAHVQAQNPELKTLADVVRFIIKRAVGKV